MAVRIDVLLAHTRVKLRKPVRKLEQPRALRGVRRREIPHEHDPQRIFRRAERAL